MLAIMPGFSWVLGIHHQALVLKLQARYAELSDQLINVSEFCWVVYPFYLIYDYLWTEAWAEAYTPTCYRIYFRNISFQSQTSPHNCNKLCLASQQVDTPTTRPDELSSIPPIHMEGGENSCGLSSDLHMLITTYTIHLNKLKAYLRTVT